jgi:capsular exopolysaccharide synthesis family protein
MSAPYGNERSDLSDLLGALRRRAWIVVLAVVVTMGAAFLYAKTSPKKYSSSAQLLFQPLYLDATLTGLPLQLPSADPTKEAGTDVGLVTLPQVRDLAAARLGPGYTADSIKHSVNVGSSSSSSIITVTATAPHPQQAANIANAVAGSYVDYRRTQLISAVKAAEASITQQENAPGVQRSVQQLLKADYTKLALLAAVQPDDVQFVSTAQPATSPSSPKTALDLIIGAVLGLILGIAIAFAVEALDRRVRRPDEIEEAIDLPLLASVPTSGALRKGGLRGLSGGEAEAFRLLRENLDHRGGDGERRCLLVTSTAPGSGKTTIALHLAAAAAAGTAGDVLLIEADLRRPRLSRMLDLPTDRGLSTLLQSDEALGDVIVHVPTGPAEDGHDAAESEFFPGSFDVLGAGPAHPRASELLRSRRMREVVDTAAREYGLVIIDGPPPGFVSDAIPLMRQSDGVIVVARVGHESGPELRRLRTELERHGVQPIGVVANFTRPVKNPYAFSGR